MSEIPIVGQPTFTCHLHFCAHVNGIDTIVAEGVKFDEVDKVVNGWRLLGARLPDGTVVLPGNLAAVKIIEEKEEESVIVTDGD
jgi:hypothetical protein